MGLRIRKKDIPDFKVKSSKEARDFLCKELEQEGFEKQYTSSLLFFKNPVTGEQKVVTINKDYITVNDNSERA